MPANPALIGAAISGGTELVNNVGNLAFQSASNRRSRQFQIDMYNRQRSDALADWNMQNQYNTPAAVMQRYQDAGLNPHLIYGNGTMASAGTPRSSSPGSYTDRPPQVNLGSPVSTYYDTRMKESQIDMMEKQKALMAVEAALKASQIPMANVRMLNTQADTAMKEFNLGLASALKPYNLAQAEENVRKTSTTTDLAIAGNARQNMLADQSIAESVARILKMKSDQSLNPVRAREMEARIANLFKDSELKTLDIRLKEKGIMPGDPWYTRMAARIADSYGKDIKKAFNDTSPGGNRVNRTIDTILRKLGLVR